MRRRINRRFRSTRTRALAGPAEDNRSLFAKEDEKS